MRKFLLITLGSLLGLLLIALIGGYFYGRGHLQDLPGIVQTALAEKHIKLKFKQIEVPSAGLTLTLKGITVEGPELPYFVDADSASMGIALAAWPPIRIFFNLNQAVVTKNQHVKGAPKTKESTTPTSASTMKMASAALALAQFEAGVYEASIPDFGVRDLSATFTLKHLALDPAGLKNAEVYHEVSLGAYDQFPLLDGLHWKGYDYYHDQDGEALVEAKGQTLTVGPFALQVGGRYELASQKWNGEISIPDTDLKSGGAIAPEQAKWIRSISGKLGVKLSAQGIGADPSGINAEGKILAQGLNLSVDYPMLKGEIRADVDTEFSKAQTLTLRSRADVDLSGAEIAYQDEFAKPKGVPLSLALTANGQNGTLTISRGEVKFNNLDLSAKGTLKLAESTSASGAITYAIPITSLSGWEKFFPKYKSMKLPGAIAASGEISSPLRGQGPGFHAKGSVSIDFPHSDVATTFSIANLSAPDIVFAVRSKRFTLRDFYNPPPGQKSEASLAAPVPTAPAASQTADFRNNPYLRKTKIDGTVSVGQLDLGTTQASNLTARVVYDKLLFKLEPVSVKAMGGTLSSSTEWDGRPKVPTARQNLKATSVDANELVSGFSPKYKDVVAGTLGTSLDLAFSGLTVPAIKSSMSGKGSFSLVNGVLKTLNLAQKPLEALKGIPGLGGKVGGNGLDAKVNDATGSIAIANQKVLLSNVVIHSSSFDASATEVAIDFDQNIQAHFIWSPKGGILPPDLMDALKDAHGVTSIPLLVSGPIRSPSVKVDENEIASRLKAYGLRKAQQAMKGQLKQALQKQLPSGLRGLFK